MIIKIVILKLIQIDYAHVIVKLCTCNCENCSKISPHPVNNCHYRCKSNLVLDEKTIRKLGMYTDCHCQCSDCIRMPNH